MLRSLKEIIGYNIQASNGEIGKVNNFLFDDRQWIIRYLVADTGNWLVDRLVLISPYALGEPEWKSKKFGVKLTKDQVKDSPKIDNDMPVSRQHEAKLNEYYGWPYYWQGLGMTVGPDPIVPVQKIPPPEDIKEKVEKEKEKYDSHLRSVNEVMKYNIQAKDGELGYVYDLIADDEKWEIIYFVIDTRKILPGKKVLCAIDWLKNIDFTKSAVEVDLSKEGIKNSPEYNPATPINREYEEQLYDFHGRPNRWWEK
jgi:hypothetical protein